MHLTTSIEVFKTNISTTEQARQLKAILLLHFPHCQINFDLEDCDRILRTDGNIQNELVKQLAEELGIRVEELLD
jgi:hypothetical protein